MTVAERLRAKLKAARAEIRSLKTQRRQLEARHERHVSEICRRLRAESRRADALEDEDLIERLGNIAHHRGARLDG